MACPQVSVVTYIFLNGFAEAQSGLGLCHNEKRRGCSSNLPLYLDRRCFQENALSVRRNSSMGIKQQIDTRT